MSYSTDLRKKVLDFLERGNQREEAANVFKVGIATIYRWLKQHKERGTLERKSSAPKKPRKYESEELIKFVENHTDATLEEIASHFKITIPAVWYALKRLKITLKKSHASIKNEMKRPEKLSKKGFSNIQKVTGSTLMKVE
ncbi:MAG: transposase [Chlamydiae bacterium]|nr:transposase [Chlamydiota bacterium]